MVSRAMIADSRSFLAAAVLLAAVLAPTVAAADCYYDGTRYPEGARIGLLVCENGEWILRP